MNKIKSGKLIKGTEIPVGDGINKPFRALVRIGNDAPIAAIVKRMPRESVIAECFAAILLQEWQVPSPNPILIIDDDQVLFGSEELYPSLKKRMDLSENHAEPHRSELIKEAARIVCSFSETPRALAADEAIDNRDRNFGNILWDGGKPSFIDHERAFGLSTDADNNKLAQMAIVAGEEEKFSRAALAAALTISMPSIASYHDDLNLDAKSFCDYVSNRLPSLASKVVSRFPQPNDLFSTQIT